jgi:hypothetical protein
MSLIRVSMAAAGSVNVAVCACFPPKVHDETQTLRRLIGDVMYRNNKLRG